MRALPRPFTSHGRKLRGKGAEKELKLFLPASTGLLVHPREQKRAKKRKEGISVSFVRKTSTLENALSFLSLLTKESSWLDVVHGQKIHDPFLFALRHPRQLGNGFEGGSFCHGFSLICPAIKHTAESPSRGGYVLSACKNVQVSSPLSPGITLFVQVVASSPPEALWRRVFPFAVPALENRIHLGVTPDFLSPATIPGDRLVLPA